ncbi:MAG: response regulator, partial [Ignavibacteria bacterium]|nr:response regulator [Ignavibacteria bacterium]
MIYKVIIVDDEYKLRELLALKLQELFPKIEIVAMAGNIKDAYDQCIALKPDIVFLDVHMPQGTGFDFIKKFSFIDFEIIFATAHQEHALEAFKVSATGFVLKPYNNEDLETAVNSAIEHLNIKYVSKKYEILIENLK